MILYHGSDHIVQQPVFNGGKPHNDYGRGFYMTESLDLAKEWACSRGASGYANIYELDTEGLNVLNLNAPEYSILNWLAVLTKYRSYWQSGSIAEEAKNYLQDNFGIDLSPYDVITGYRADDSYFSFAQDFISGAISLRKLSEAMKLGKLGEQHVLKSEKSYSRIRFCGYEIAEADVYYARKLERDRLARREYRSSRSSADGLRDIYIIDIMREGMKNDDPRLR